jgi:hypothetical protein
MQIVPAQWPAWQRVDLRRLAFRVDRIQQSGSPVIEEVPADEPGRQTSRNTAMCLEETYKISDGTVSSANERASLFAGTPRRPADLASARADPVSAGMRPTALGRVASCAIGIYHIYQGRNGAQAYAHNFSSTVCSPSSANAHRGCQGHSPACVLMTRRQSVWQTAVSVPDQARALRARCGG